MPSRDESHPASSSPPTARKTRVDAAHGSQSSAMPEAAENAQPEEAQSQQAQTQLALSQQARQLEGHLQRRQQDLDHRESQLNARIAAFERETRATRMALREQEREVKSAREAFSRPDTRVVPATDDSPSAAAPSVSQAQLKRELQLDNREQELTAREKELRRRANEIYAAREESLEIRLATEELWRQLCDALPPEAVNRSVARIRERLTEHYRLVREDLNDYRAQLQQIRLDLDERLERWSHRKAELAEWAQRQMQEIDTYHAAVSERAAAVDQRQSELTLLQSAWRQDRQELETRIARLQQRLDQAGKPAPVSAIPVPHSRSAAKQQLPKSGAA